MSNLKDIHNTNHRSVQLILLLYQDFNEQFEGYTQLLIVTHTIFVSCFIRISMSNLKDIHNNAPCFDLLSAVALSGFQ